MARLIDLDLAIAEIKDYGLLGAGYSDYERIDDVCDTLESCLIVDAVEVVRCKDCSSGKGSKVKPCPLYKQGLMKDEDFCSKGERRTDGER